MSRVAEVLDSTRVNDEGGHGLDVKCDPGGGDNVTAPHFASPGDDGRPLPGDFVALEDSAGSGAEHATGYADVRNAGKAAPGEKRIYARDANGAVVAEVWIKGNRTIVITNDQGSFEMAPNGDVTINGVKIDASGNITAPGEITAKAASPATAVTVSQHIHPHPMGPTSAPTPGT